MKWYLAVSALVLAVVWFFMQGALPMIRRNSEGSTMGRLGAIRSALSIYYGDMEGRYPSDLAAMTVEHQGKDGKPKVYLESIPAAQCRSPYHPTPDCKKNMEPGIHDKILYAKTPDDAGGWGYNNDPHDANIGSLWVNCTHTDIRGRVYSAY
jgi:hypothetical protein